MKRPYSIKKSPNRGRKQYGGDCWKSRAESNSIKKSPNRGRKRYYLVVIISYHLIQ